jgi:hypothetical protein
MQDEPPEAHALADWSVHAERRTSNAMGPMLAAESWPAGSDVDRLVPAEEASAPPLRTRPAGR